MNRNAIMPEQKGHLNESETAKLVPEEDMVEMRHFKGKSDYFERYNVFRNKDYDYDATPIQLHKEASLKKQDSCELTEEHDHVF